MADVWVNAKWVARATAIYTLPFNVSVSGFLNGHQGYIFPYGFTTPDRGNGAGTVTVVMRALRRVASAELLAVRLQGGAPG